MSIINLYSDVSQNYTFELPTLGSGTELAGFGSGSKRMIRYSQSQVLDLLPEPYGRKFLNVRYITNMKYIL